MKLIATIVLMMATWLTGFSINDFILGIEGQGLNMIYGYVVGALASTIFVARHK